MLVLTAYDDTDIVMEFPKADGTTVEARVRIDPRGAGMTSRASRVYIDAPIEVSVYREGPHGVVHKKGR